MWVGRKFEPLAKLGIVHRLLVFGSADKVSYLEGRKTDQDTTESSAKMLLSTSSQTRWPMTMYASWIRGVAS